MPNTIAKCGHFTFDETMKMIDNVICLADAIDVIKDNAVTPCGQPFDGSEFKVVTRGTSKILTLHDAYCPQELSFFKGPCSIGLDKRFFKVENGVIGLTDVPAYYTLTVNAVPEDSVIEVEDSDINVVLPVEGTKNKFELNRIGENYVVHVTKDGFKSSRQEIKNDKSQTIQVNLEPEAPII